MIRLCLTLLFVCLFISRAAASTAPDLRGQIPINGDVADFAPDDWVLDDSTTFRELPDDSQWGTDNDIRAIAVTWDNYNLYVGVPAVVVSTTLMLFLDVGCGGVDNLHTPGNFRRNIEFSVNTPNVLMRVLRQSVSPELAAVDCNHPVSVADPAEYQGIYVAQGATDGALEIAVPWDLLPGFAMVSGGVEVPIAAQDLRVLAVVAGGPGMGAGDAAPDPSVVLDGDSTHVAILNNYVQLPLDGDGDGLLDIGVSPRAIATYGVMATENVAGILPIRVLLQNQLFAPGNGESLDFVISLNPPDYQQIVYLTGRIYSSTGELLRNLFDNEPHLLAGSPLTKSWDGRDNGGQVVPGGIYVLAVSGGPAGYGSKNTVSASFAVIR